MLQRKDFICDSVLAGTKTLPVLSVVSCAGTKTLPVLSVVSCAGTKTLPVLSVVSCAGTKTLPVAISSIMWPQETIGWDP